MSSVPSLTPSATPVSAARPFARAVVVTIGILLVMDVAGALISLSAGLSPTFLDALGPQARLSAPIPMMIAQAILAFAVSGRRRAVAAPAAVLLMIAGILAFVSGFSDGGYAADLTAAQRVFQVALVAGHLVMGVLAGLRLVKLLRR
ncbi:hypothetical protein GCM10009555_075780 [Acrocarpospora macrocephala]|uniref:Uncharacterized protein n=1 Tax=Acrocarpospora macrocephala TaxID=150177 RepID=A0A5M3XD45_9ACTN|nr:hypothetical protein [Acrocarpospora macrocephala]GES16813.1 hypothetical protein Amac_104110 [Acrocarpospora macrocephala]